MKKQKIWAASGIAAALLIAVILMFFAGNEEIIPQSEVKQQVSTQYGSEVVSMDLTRLDGTNVYDIDLTNKRGSYRMVMDARSGEILNLSQVKASPPSSPYNVSEKQAESIALKEQNGTVQSIKKGMDKENPVYFVKVKTNTGMIQLTIDGGNGNVTRQVQEKTDGDHPPQKTVIHEDEAKKIALQNVKGQVTDIELEENNDQFEYHVTIDTGSDTQNIYINAYTGELSSVSWEDESEEDDDDEDDAGSEED